MLNDTFSVIVTSFTLVWIKIFVGVTCAQVRQVTSFTLVWIKMPVLAFGFADAVRSRASRSCGLK